MVENTSRSLIERLRERIAARKTDGEQGSLILDLAIGMAIFALIAGIALSALGQYRARAYMQSAVSDAQALGLAVEAALTDASGAMTVVPQAAPNDNKFDIRIGTTTYETVTFSHQGDNVLTGFSAPTPANGYVFSYCVVHSSTEWARYESANGGVVRSDREGPCS